MAVTRKSTLTRVSADARTEHLVKREGATGSLAIVASGHGPRTLAASTTDRDCQRCPAWGRKHYGKARKPVSWFLFR